MHQHGQPHSQAERVRLGEVSCSGCVLPAPHQLCWSRRVNHVARISAMLKAMFRDDQRGRLLRHVLEHDATVATRQHRIAAGKKSSTRTAGKRKKYTCHLI